MGTHFWAAEIYISACKPKRVILRKTSWPTSQKFLFLKIWHFVSNIHFESREVIKTRWATAFWNLSVTKCQVFDIKGSSTIRPAWYLFSGTVNITNGTIPGLFWITETPSEILRRWANLIMYLAYFCFVAGTMYIVVRFVQLLYKTREQNSSNRRRRSGVRPRNRN
jgi:hypothetical protein